MNVNLELYKLFYIVANNGNITKASQELCLSQPALSKSIQQLEEQLNCQLFTRNKRGVVLTVQGEILYKHVTEALHILDRALYEVSCCDKMPPQILNIGVGKTLTKHYVLPYLREFLKTNPSVKLNIIGGSFDEKIGNVRKGLLDFIVLYLPTDVPSDFQAIFLKEIKTILVGNENFRDLQEKCIEIKDLNNYPLVMNAKGATTRKYIDMLCERENMTLKPKMELASTMLVTNFIESGYGIGFLTKEYVQDKLDNGQLYEIKTNPKIDRRYIGIIYLKNRPLSPMAREFIDYLRTQ